MKAIFRFIVLLACLNTIYGSCRNNCSYYKDGNGWYKLYKEPKLYEDAKKTCKGEGAVLAPTDSIEVILNIVRKSNVDKVFVSTGNDYDDDLDSGHLVYDPLDGLKMEVDAPRAYICHYNGSKDDDHINGCAAAHKINYTSYRSNANNRHRHRFYRNDYTYVPEVKGWLKFHQIPANWNEARVRCHFEGATLASPLNNPIKNTMINIARQSNLERGIYTGISATYSRGDFYSVEGVPLNEIPVCWAAEEPNNTDDKEQCLILRENGTSADVDCKHTYPYICYKRHTRLGVSSKCGTTDLDYKYSEATGRCYKFHRSGQRWSRAFLICSAEGGHLAIINSAEEAQVLNDIFKQYPSGNIIAEKCNVIFLGFRAENRTTDFITVEGQTLKEAGYESWGKGEPNNSRGLQSCGGMFRNGLLDDLDCERTVPFICEKKPWSLLD